MVKLAMVLGILVAGFLGFVAQPILAKLILPVFGGGGGVWTLVSIAFQAVLLMGYCYALFLLKQSKRTQIIIHVALICVTGCLLYFFSGAFFGELSHLWVLVGVGMSYFILTSTSPLVQGWIGGAMSVSEMAPVYRLFSYSNLAAILGLFAYPFLIEPNVGWRVQMKTWSLFYFLYACFMLFLLFKIGGRRAGVGVGLVRPSVRTFLYWCLVPAVSTSYLLALSFSFSQNIPPSPLVWTIPLSLYLLSYSVAFAGWIGKTFKFVLLPLGLLFGGVLFVSGIDAGGLSWEMFPPHCALFFVGCLLLHGMIFEARPDGPGLPKFYVALGIGGLVGGCFSLLVVPQLFVGAEEIWFFHLVAVVASVVVVVSLYFERIRGWGGVVLSLNMAFLVFFLAVAEAAPGGEGLYKKIRNFHGAFLVQDNVGWTLQRDLIHGGTAHGSQSLVVGEGGIPTSYYTRHSGLGAVSEWFEQKNRQVSILCVGMGVGTVATMAGRGDTIHFVDINKDIIKTAMEDFSYAKDAEARGAEVKITHGDGRKSLEGIPSNSVDFFILDAFSGGGIPVHLLTEEAFQEYNRVLRNGGLMAIHVSSRSIKLEGVVFSGMLSAGVHPVLLQSDGGGIGTASIWVVGSRDSRVVKEVSELHQGQIEQAGGLVTWSDDFSSIYNLFK